MSQPARPTRLKRKAVLLRAVPRRRSDAMATMAPAPAQTPSMAATIGCGQARIALTRSPVMRVNISSSGAFSAHQRADDLVHVAARAEVVAGARHHHGVHVGGVLQLAEQVAQFGVRVEGERVLALGPVERDGGHRVFHLPEKVTGLVAGQRFAVARGQGRVEALVAARSSKGLLQWVEAPAPPLPSRVPGCAPAGSWPTGTASATGRPCSRSWPPPASVQEGLARCGRATAHRSARPAAMMLLTWSASEIAPTAMVGMPASLRMRSANGVWYMRPYTGFCCLLTWPEEQSIMSAPAALKARAISTASSGVMPPSTQSWAEMRTDIGRCCGPYRAHGAEHFQRIAQAVLQRAAVFVGALVGQRRDEAGQQVAVRAVQLQPVEAGLGRQPRCCARSRRRTRSMSARVIARDQSLTPSRYCCGDAEISGQLPCASGWSSPSHGTRVEPLAPAWPSCMAIFASVLRVHEIDDALPAIALRLAPQAGAAGRDAGIGRRAGHLGHDHAGAAHGARAQVHQVVVGRHPVDAGVLRHRRDHDAVLQRDAARRERREHRRAPDAAAASGARPIARRSSPRSPPHSPCRAAAGSRG